MKTFYKYAKTTYVEVCRFGILRLFKSISDEHYELHIAKMTAFHPITGKVGSHLGLSPLGKWGVTGFSFSRKGYAYERFQSLVTTHYPHINNPKFRVDTTRGADDLAKTLNP